jgi:dipeptidyl aminopeptidase/acylaminoacyl peptidase
VKRFALCLVAILALGVLPASAVQEPASEERIITPNENLVVDGIPQIPASLAEEVNRYTESRAASLSSWHPTKREMLVITRFGDTPQAHHVAMPGGARRQLTFYPERVSGASFQPTTGERFVFAKDIGGNEFYQLFSYDVSSGDVTMLTPGGRTRNSRGPWSTDGKWLAYSSTRRTGADTDLYVVDPADPKSDRMVSTVEGGGWSPLDWSPDDRSVLVSEYVSVNESYLWLFDVANGKKTAITTRGPVKIAVGSAVFSKDGKGLFLTSDEGSEFQRLAYYDLATKKATWLTDHIKWDVEEIDLSDDGATLAFVTNEDGISVLHLLDTKSMKERPAPKVPTGVIGGLSWHKNNVDLGMTISSARAATDVYSVDTKTLAVTRWTESETGGLDTSAFAEPSLVRWKSFDGREISGFLYRPPAKFTGKRPVIVNIHGGPESQFRPTFLGRNNYFVNEMGVAMIFPNVRGSAGYGKTFLTLDNGFKREDSVKDIGALLDWIATQPDLDASRVMVTGGSYGGYMTLAVATNYDARIRASLDVVGISSFVSFLERTESYRRDLRRVEYGDERDPQMREFLLKIAPLTNAGKITKPLFVVQGANDPRVPLNEAEQMVKTVKGNNSPVWYLMAKDEGHGFAKKKNADYQFFATIMFIREHLLG